MESVECSVWVYNGDKSPICTIWVCLWEIYTQPIYGQFNREAGD